MSGQVFYIPIMCCGQEMADVYQGEERVAATCSICGKVWKPTPNTNFNGWNLTFGKITFLVDPTMPADEIKLVGPGGQEVKIVNIGDEND